MSRQRLEEIKRELDGRITSKEELEIYLQFRLEGMAEVGAIEMLNSFNRDELLAIGRFRRLYSHYFPVEHKRLIKLDQQNNRYRKAMIEAREISSCCGETAGFILAEALEGEK